MKQKGETHGRVDYECIKLWISYCGEYLSVDSIGDKIRLSDRKYSWADNRIEKRLTRR